MIPDEHGGPRPGSVPTLRWPTAPAAQMLAPGEVHVWCAWLRPEPKVRDEFYAALSKDERARADRFRFPVHRDRFITRRGVLRAIVGRYLQTAPEALSLRATEYGKPELGGYGMERVLHFNASNSEDLGLYAVASDRPVGVDLEVLRPMSDAVAIAERFFSPHEYAAFRAIPANGRDRAFFACWTRKEAFLKGLGTGLFAPLDSFDVTVTPDEPPRLLRTRGDSLDSARWTLHDLDLGPRWVATLAVQGPTSAIREFSWRSNEWR